MGVTVAVAAHYVEGRPPEDLRSDVRDLADQIMPKLRIYVGQAKPQSPFATKFDGPVDDPLQGHIYALTVAALFDDDDLPADCNAYIDVAEGRVPASDDLTGFTTLT